MDSRLSSLSTEKISGDRQSAHTTLAAAVAIIVSLGLGSESAAATVTVTLVPHRSVVGTTTTVSFGLPLPPGLVQVASKIAVYGPDGTRLPAFVRSLGVWNAMPPRELQCTGLPTTTSPGIRSALVQFPYRFTTSDPVYVKVDTAALPRPWMLASVPVRSTWRLADQGSYGASDGIFEPSVYALLPPNWLACSNLTTLATAGGADTLLSTFDGGQVNFLAAVINDFNPNPNPAYLVEYRTDSEPWLYDRAQTFYNGYIRTGRLDFLTEAHRAVQHYMKMLYRAGDCPGIPDQWCRGFFSLKNPATQYYKDSKYSYNESMATLYWLTGDPEPLTHLSDVTSATRVESDLTRTLDLQAWTERHSANAFLAPLFEYEVTGNQELLPYIKGGVDQLEALQNSPVDGAVNGCFNHYVEYGPVLSFSPWMSSLLAHAFLRTYHTTLDSRMPGMIEGLGRCIGVRGLYTPTDAGAPAYLMPRYIASSQGPPASLDGDPWSDFEHSADAAYISALGAFFSKDAATSRWLDATTRTLLLTHAYDLAVWTRPDDWPANGAPLYRVSPPRKYAWWYKNTGAIGWALDGATAFISQQ